MSARRTRMIALVGLVVAPLALVTSAVANGGVGGELSDSGTTLLMPGSEIAGDFTVANESDTVASLRVRVADLAEDDNGCVRPEQQAGDVTCGTGGGELGPWLRLRVLRIDGVAEHELWAGQLAQLQESVELVGDVAAREALRLRLVIALPRPASNDTMSDQVGFTLRSTLVGVAAPSTSTVVSVEAKPGGSTFGPLAATGSSVSAWLLVLSLVLAGTGGILMVQGRPRSGA